MDEGAISLIQESLIRLISTTEQADAMFNGGLLAATDSGHNQKSQRLVRPDRPATGRRFQLCNGRAYPKMRRHSPGDDAASPCGTTATVTAQAQPR